MDSLGDLLELYRTRNFLKAQKEEERSAIIWYVLGAIVAAVSVAAIIYAAYRFFKPDQLDDFDDEFEDDFDDDFFDDEDMANGTGA